jgi:UDP-N-acetylglucosamine--N-acetylmuramyl-(pentapeptide) pyrophosphoryl-undecaprenol N-acetylglucosamine transferase
VYKRGKAVFTGNPVRPEIKHGDREKGYRLTGFSVHKPVLLVWGGSQGAAYINGLISAYFNELTAVFQIVHVTGGGKKTALGGHSYKQFEYLDEDLKHIYAITDIVLGRAGANSLYELAFMQKTNVLIPLDSADQPKNAEYFEKEGGSIILKYPPAVVETLAGLWKDHAVRETMRRSLAALARPHAAEEIAELLVSF